MNTRILLASIVVLLAAQAAMAELTSFVGTDFLLGPYWNQPNPVPDPECQEAWTITGIAYAADVSCPHWPDNGLGSGQMEGKDGPHTFADLNFGLGPKGPVTKEDNPLVRVSWCWMMTDNPAAQFSVKSGGLDILQSGIGAGSGQITLTYGPDSDTFLLAENIDKNVWYQVTLDIDVVQAGIVTGTVIREADLPAGDELFHTARNLPLLWDADGFDEIKAVYFGTAGAGPMNWDEFQVCETPEPAALSLLALGALAMLRRRSA